MATYQPFAGPLLARASADASDKADSAEAAAVAHADAGDAQVAADAAAALAGVLGRIRAARAPTGSIGGGASANVTVTWPDPLPTADYTVVAAVQNGDSGEGLRVGRVLSRALDAVVVRVENAALLSRSGTVHVWAWHDD